MCCCIAWRVHRFGPGPVPTGCTDIPFLSSTRTCIDKTTSLKKHPSSTASSSCLPLKATTSQAEAPCRAQTIRCSGANCKESCQHAVRRAFQPADLPLGQASRVQSPPTHGYRHSNSGLRQGPGDTSRIDESDKEQNVLSQSGPSPTGTSYYSPTPHRGLEQSLHRTKTATEALASPSKPFDPSAIPSSICPLFVCFSSGSSSSLSRSCNYSDT